MNWLKRLLALLLAILRAILRQHEIARGTITFTSNGVQSMSGSFSVGKTVTGTVAFTNPDGTAGAPASPPSWSFDNPAVWNPTVAADGLSAAGTLLAAGICNVTVVAEGDPTPGVDTVTLTGSLAATEEISGGTLVFTAS